MWPRDASVASVENVRISVESGSLSANLVERQDWMINCGHTTTSIVPES